MWKRYFRFVKLKPGKVVTALYGEIDFSADNLVIEIIKSLYESDFPYLEITEEGKVELYGIKIANKKDSAKNIPNRVKKSREKSIH